MSMLAPMADRWGVDTIDMFGDRRTDQQRRDAIEIQRRLLARRGGEPDYTGLPAFGQAQLDLFDHQDRENQS